MVRQDKEQSAWIMIGILWAISAFAFYTLWSKSVG